VDRDRIEATLLALYKRGRAAHPDLGVDDVVFAAHLGRCGAPIARVAVPEIHAEDLYLCCAALAGSEPAIRKLRNDYRAVVTNHLRTIDSSVPFAEEIEQRLWDSALVGQHDSPPKLASYAGRGPLAAWLGVAAQRIALMIRRSEAAEKRAIDGVAMEIRIASADPELAFVKEHLRESFQRAIIKAFDALDDRQRLIYTLHVIDGLTVERIATIYSVSHSTVSRWMSAARAAIISEAQRILRDDMQVPAEEFDSLARLLASDLDLSISAILSKSA